MFTRLTRTLCLGKAQTQSLFGGFSFNWRVQHDLQREGLVLGSGWLRPLLVAGDYWFGMEVVMDGCEYLEFDSKRRELASDATIRDYFAVAAMQAIVRRYDGHSFGGGSESPQYKELSDDAYYIADAMLKARNQ